VEGVAGGGAAAADLVTGDFSFVRLAAMDFTRAGMGAEIGPALGVAKADRVEETTFGADRATGTDSTETGVAKVFAVVVCSLLGNLDVAASSPGPTLAFACDGRPRFLATTGAAEGEIPASVAGVDTADTAVKVDASMAVGVERRNRGVRETDDGLAPAAGAIGVFGLAGAAVCVSVAGAGGGTTSTIVAGRCAGSGVTARGDFGSKARNTGRSAIRPRFGGVAALPLAGASAFASSPGWVEAAATAAGA